MVVVGSLVLFQSVAFRDAMWLLLVGVEDGVLWTARLSGGEWTVLLRLSVESGDGGGDSVGDGVDDGSDKWFPLLLLDSRNRHFLFQENQLFLLGLVRKYTNFLIQNSLGYLRSLL